MQVELGEEQNKLMKTIAETNGFVDYNLTLESGSTKGDGYLGIIISITIKNGEHKLNVILKWAPKGGNRLGFPIRDLYLNEIYMYEKMFVSFEKFQKDNDLPNGFKAYAKFYGKCDKEANECLVLENLVESGYKLWNRKIPMNSEHIALVMAEYGKLHAVSFAMKCKNPQLFKEITEFLKRPASEPGGQNLKIFIDNIANTVPKAVEGNVKAENAFKKLMTDPMKFFLEDLTADENHFVVIHGDCWCNNMLFKYEDPFNDKKPSDLRLIDWQVSNLGIPIIDLSYALCTNSPLEIISDYMTYLKIYHDSLCKNLRSMSCDPEEIYPFSLLERHWKKYAKYGLFLASLMYKVVVVESDDAPEFKETTNSVKDFFNHFNSTKNVHVANQRIAKLFEFMDKEGLV